MPKGRILLRDIVLDNATGRVIQVPFDLTVLRWTGSEWEKQPCQEPDTKDGVWGLCGTANTNAQMIQPG